MCYFPLLYRVQGHVQSAIHMDVASYIVTNVMQFRLSLPLSSLLVCIQMGIGQASSFAPDYQKASKAALGIVELLVSTSEIDPEVTTGSPIQGQGQGKADSDNGGNAESRMDGN